MSVVSTSGLTKYFKELCAIDHVTLDVENEIFGLLGPNGAGKSTIALMVDDHDGYAAVNSTISMPLFFASSALMPYTSMPAWLRPLAMLNPVSYAIDTTRSIFFRLLCVHGPDSIGCGGDHRTRYLHVHL